MRFRNYIQEKTLPRGAELTAIDIDETVFKTFSKILVVNNGSVVRELDNQEFNAYKLLDGEEYDFRQFRSAELFNKTSIPIPQTVRRIKRMLGSIEKSNLGSKIIFLTARADFDDKETFLDTFRKYGIKMDMPNVYVERSGNLDGGTVPERKERILMKYLSTGKYRIVRLIDDHKPNVDALIQIEKKFGKDIENAVRMYYNIPEDEEGPLVQYFGLWIKQDGSIKLVNR